MPYVNRRKSTVVLTLLFVLHALPWLVRPFLIGGDEAHYALMAGSIAVDRDVDLGEDYLRIADGSRAAGFKRAGTELDPHVRVVNGREVFSHPLGLPLLAAPLVALQQALLPGSAPDFLLGIFGLCVTFAALLAGRELLERSFGVGDLAIGFYFASPLWFYSRTFFTEPYIWSAVVLALWLITRERFVAAGALFGAALALKESALLAVAPVLLAGGLGRGWKRAMTLLAGPITVVGLWAAKNMVVYGRWFETFQAFRMGNPFRGLLGVLLDPRHGVLVFAPVVVLVVAGMPRRQPPRESLTDPLDCCLAGDAPLPGAHLVLGGLARRLVLRPASHDSSHRRRRRSPRRGLATLAEPCAVPQRSRDPPGGRLHDSVECGL